MSIRIISLKHLEKICKGREQLDCFILLNGGLRSSKTFMLDSDGIGFVVINEIDDTTQEFESFEELMDESKTNIGKAIKLGGFYVHDYEEVE